MNNIIISEITKDELSSLIRTELSKVLAERDAAKETTKQKPGEKELLTTNEVCCILQVSKMTLNRWNKAKYLCPVKVGMKNMYKMEDIKALQK